MAAALRTVRVKLPRVLSDKLTALAKTERQSISALILRAVKSDLFRRHSPRRP